MSTHYKTATIEIKSLSKAARRKMRKFDLDLLENFETGTTFFNADFSIENPPTIAEMKEVFAGLPDKFHLEIVCGFPDLQDADEPYISFTVDQFTELTESPLGKFLQLLARDRFARKVVEIVQAQHFQRR